MNLAVVLRERNQVGHDAFGNRSSAHRSGNDGNDRTNAAGANATNRFTRARSGSLDDSAASPCAAP
jgi:hypothetical protein